MPRPKEYVVTFSAGERSRLVAVASRGTSPARMIARARILLALDESHGSCPDRGVVAERVGVSEGTVFAVAKRYRQVGGDVEAVIELGCRVVSGHGCWVFSGRCWWLTVGR